jgi:hypothetical protein
MRLKAIFPVSSHKEDMVLYNIFLGNKAVDYIILFLQCQNKTLQEAKTPACSYIDFAAVVLQAIISFIFPGQSIINVS